MSAARLRKEQINVEFSSFFFPYLSYLFSCPSFLFAFHCLFDDMYVLLFYSYVIAEEQGL